MNGIKDFKVLNRRGKNRRMTLVFNDDGGAQIFFRRFIGKDARESPGATCSFNRGIMYTHIAISKGALIALSSMIAQKYPKEFGTQLHFDRNVPVKPKRQAATGLDACLTRCATVIMPQSTKEQ